VFITPEGTVIEGRAGPGLDLFPGLARYRFTTPQTPGRRQPAPPHTPADPHRTRTADKHARRRAERDRNRRARADGRCIEPPAVRAHIAADDAATHLGDPPY
ncbi:hypothetical protein HH308_28535, partial [Gordonia sp. TBRC 11910]|nr:hypothetical protein [Gordonia asplenii]